MKNKPYFSARPGTGVTSKLTFDAATHYLYRYACEGKIAILIHARPDGDCIGSGFAMKKLLAGIGCESCVVCADRLPARLKFISDGSEIAADSVPDEYAPGSGCRAIALDVAAPSQLGSLENSYNIVLSLDHHIMSTPVADGYLDATAAATGEIVWRIARNWLRAGIIGSIPDGMAENVYAAISSDTGGFRYSNVTANTHRIAAQLVQHVPEHAEIDRLLFEVKSEERLAAEKAAMDYLRKYRNGTVTVCAMTMEQIAERGLSDEDLEALIDVARSVNGSQIAYSVREEAKGIFRISARSNGNADVSEICRRFGGGGHVKASGATIEAADIEEAVKLILRETDRVV